MSRSERKIPGNDGHNLKCLINGLMNRLGFILFMPMPLSEQTRRRAWAFYVP